MGCKELVKSTYDLRVHSVPDVPPRKMDDIEMTQRVKENGMTGYAIEGHCFYTSERAELINRLYPDYDTVDTITLNSSVGDINPTAVGMATRNGAKLVWFLTCGSTREIAHVFDENPNKKLPYQTQTIIQMKEAGVQASVIHILEGDGALKKPVMDVLDIIAKYNMVLATGHVSHEEAFALVKEAKDHGVKKIIVTHMDFPTTYYIVEGQKQFVEMGAMMEHCYTTWVTGKAKLEVTKEMIREVGPADCILTTDLGQKTALYPDRNLLEFAKRLYDDGFAAEEIRTMTVDSPRALLGR